MLVLNDLSDAYRPDFAVLLLDGDATPTRSGERSQLDSLDFSKDVTSTVNWVLERNLTLVTLVVKIYHLVTLVVKIYHSGLS
jgi:hypothetical protein